MDLSRACMDWKVHKMELSRAYIVPKVQKSDLSWACSGLQVKEMVLSRAYIG